MSICSPWLHYYGHCLSYMHVIYWWLHQQWASVAFPWCRAEPEPCTLSYTQLCFCLLLLDFVTGYKKSLYGTIPLHPFLLYFLFPQSFVGVKASQMFLDMIRKWRMKCLPHTTFSQNGNDLYFVYIKRDWNFTVVKRLFGFGFLVRSAWSLSYCKQSVWGIFDKWDSL